MILHLPLRSFGQYRSRLGIGLRIARTRESDQLEERIGEVIGEDAARERWRDLIGDERDTEAALTRGELVEDTRLRDLMRAIGPPEEGAVEPPAFTPAQLEPDSLRAARADLTREALAGMAHNHAQALGERDAALASLAAKTERLEATRVRSRERTATIARQAAEGAQARARARPAPAPDAEQPLVAAATAPAAETGLEAPLEHRDGSTGGGEGDVAPDRPLGLARARAELDRAQDGLQRHPHLELRERRADAAPGAAAERDPGVRLGVGRRGSARGGTRTAPGRGPRGCG